MSDGAAPGGGSANAAPLDLPGPVRAGEDLALAALARWLEEQLPELAGPLAVEQFPGGHSNLTYLLRAAGRELVLRRPPFGSSVKTAHDMGREFRVLSRLADHYPKAPRALAWCDDPAVLGAPFYLMERVRGIILRSPRPPAGIELPPARMRALSEAAIDGLAELHGVDFAAAGLAELGRPEGYVERQVGGWTGRWQRARTDPVPEIDDAAAWLAAHLPRAAAQGGGGGPAILHNDYKYDNLVFAPDLSRIVAVLDWEMATVGDPLMDLGTTLAYWLDREEVESCGLPAGPTALPGNLSRTEVVEHYARRSGREVGEVLFYFVFGLLKIAVIAQQIYFRYRQGLTHDERFARLLEPVRALGRTACQAIALRRIDLAS
ncbi:MAG TPA: phosphotransferase family protein [Thermoanaerobaculia bacterium]|nr:phosphotransferase family protein [Thermoanaerobaculia bacterium]